MDTAHRLLAALAAGAALLAGAIAAAEDPVAAAAGRRGICLHLGCGDGARTLAIARASGLAVHALGDEAAAAATAAAARAADLHERVAAEPWSAPGLPHMDRCADLIVVEAGWRVDDAELLRVLVPGGTALRAEGAAWRALTAPAAAGADDWTHQRRGADGNARSRDAALARAPQAPPDRMRWVDDVPIRWSDSIRIADGRAFVLDHGAAATTVIVRCRSAWNGALLWERELPDAAPGPRYGPIMRPVATAARLYLRHRSIVALDAADGRTAAEVDLAALELIAPDDGRAGVVVVRSEDAVVALDALDLSPRWRVPAPLPPAVLDGKRKGGALAARMPGALSDGRLVYALAQAAGAPPRLVGLDLADGAERWSSDGARLGADAWPIVVADGVLIVAGTGYVAGLPVDGKGEPWRLAIGEVVKGKDGALARRDADMAQRALVCALAQGGRLWLREDLSTVVGERDLAAPAPDLLGWVGVDLRTGSATARVGYPTARPWGGIDADGPMGVLAPKLERKVVRNWSPRCYADIAGPSAILSQTMEIVGYAGEEPRHLRGVRGQCGIGFIAGALQVITPPNQCIGCYPMVRGAIAYESPAAVAPAPLADGERLVRGPAFGAQRAGGAAGVGGPRAEDWPMYRGDAKRTNCAPQRIDPAALAEAWARPGAGRATQAVVAGGVAVVAAIGSGRVTAFDAATGAVRWEAALPARIDTAPTLHGGLVLAGCHDGRVHALDLADGRLAWRFTAAPRERRIVVGGRVESPWPVLGAVLVHAGAVHAVAGHHSALEGGLERWGLDPATGAVRYRATFAGIKGEQAVILPTHWYKHEEVALNNVLLGGEVAGPDGRPVAITRLYDEWGGWDFRADDGILLRQHGAVPQPGWPKGRISPGAVTADDRWPWVGHDRVSLGFILRGLPLGFTETLETDPRTRLSGMRGQIFICPRPGAAGALISVKAGHTTVDPEPWIVPTDPAVFAEGKLFAADPARTNADLWTPQRFPIAACAALISAEQVLWLAGRAHVEAPAEGAAAAPAASALVAIAMADGKQLGRWDFPGEVAFDGLSAAGGRLYLAQADGTLRCFAPR